MALHYWRVCPARMGYPDVNCTLPLKGQAAFVHGIEMDLTLTKLFQHNVLLEPPGHGA